MPPYSTLAPLSRVQIRSERRKQQAHLKKISDMKLHSGLNNNEPVRFAFRSQNFQRQFDRQREKIDQENEVKVKKLYQIMTSNPVHSPPPFHPTRSVNRSNSVTLSQENSDYQKRIANAKGKYDVRKWNKEFDEHKSYLRISKNNKVFTPLDIGINRVDTNKSNSLNTSKQSSQSLLSVNLNKKTISSN